MKDLVKEKSLVKINASDYGLEESKASEIEAMFTPMLSKMSELEKDFNDILKLPINHETCKMAKELRLAYVKVRTGTAAIHKQLKDFYLKGGRFVDAFKNTQEFASGEKEKTLKAIEDHFENLERERTEKLRIDRLELLKPYTEIEPLGLGHMQEDVFNNYLIGVKLALKQKLEAEKKAEEERIAIIEAEKKRQEEIIQENIRLKEQAEERERLAEIERKKQAEILAKERAKAEIERKERERLESEIKAKQEAQEKAEKELKDKEEAERKAKIAAEKKALRAPDKNKIKNLSELIGSIEMPEVKSDEAKEIIQVAKDTIHKLITYINQKSESL